MGKTRDAANLVSDGNLSVNIDNDRIGSGTTNPVSQLHVRTGPVIIGSGTTTGTASQTLQVTGGTYVSGNLGVGSTNPAYTVSVVGDINFSGSLYQNGTLFTSGSSSQWVSTAAGIHTLSNVGIGTTNPTSKLSVTGNANFTGVVTATSFSGDGSSLSGIAAAKGGGTNKIFFENDQEVTFDYTISTSKNAMSAGPVAIATGITVTIPSGSTWTIV